MAVDSQLLFHGRHEPYVWFIRLRWVVCAALAVAITVAHDGLHLFESVAPLWGYTLLLALGNLALIVLVQWARRTRRRLDASLVYSQIVLDFVVFVGLLHWSGGIQNPFAFLMALHVILAAIVLPRGAPYWIAIGALVVLTGMGVSELNGWVEVHPLQFADLMGRRPTPHDLAVVLASFTVVCFTAAYLVSTIVKQVRQLQDNLAMHERMAGIGQLAAGVAHEVNNPLAAISSLVQSLIRKSPDPLVQQRLPLALEHVSRISEIVRSLNEFASPGRSAPHLTDVNSTLEQTLEMIRYDQRARRCTIEMSVDAQLPPVMVIADQLAQVFMNLALNALDAMPGGGILRVTTRVAGQAIEIVFEDQGPGVSAQVGHRVFEPFFTTKPVGGGTGLGLFVSYTLVQKMSGSLTLDNPGAAGARFVVRLPCSAEGVPSSADKRLDR